MRELEIYSTWTPAKLATLINDTVAQYKLDDSWRAPRPRHHTVQVAHIEELCNEWGFCVRDDGKLHRFY